MVKKQGENLVFGSFCLYIHGLYKWVLGESCCLTFWLVPITSHSRINLTWIKLVLSTPSTMHSSEASGPRDHVDIYLQIITMKNGVIDNWSSNLSHFSYGSSWVVSTKSRFLLRTVFVMATTNGGNGLQVKEEGFVLTLLSKSKYHLQEKELLKCYK